MGWGRSVADLTPPDPTTAPTWVIAAGSVLTTVLGWQAWKPVGAWLARRLDIHQKAQLEERTNYMSRLITELSGARKELEELRQDLGEERELRMALAVDVAVLTERNESMSKAMAEDKRDCQRAIRSLRDEITRLQKQRGLP